MSFLQRSYSRADFLNFVSNDFLPEFSNDKRPVRTHEKSLLKDVQKLGDSTSLGLSVFEAACDESDHGKRVAITMDAFRILRDTATRNALIVFYSKDSSKWRLSLLTSNFELDSKGKVTSKMSNPRRFSYLLGEDAKTVTPHKYLEAKGTVKDFNDLQSRFAVEVVNNDFYKEIAKLYDELVGTDEITGSLRYPGQGEVSHQFAVRLIGRVIFCWFLREKKSDKGTPLIPEEILSGGAAIDDNYYHNVLAPLFFEVLNKHGKSRSEKFREGLYASIPYLNGGLFNPDLDDHYKFDKALQLSVPGLVDVPDKWLRSFLDLLELYNFTVDENTSYDVELSIDPEMLGRIFENLLARINPETGETVRKMTGSFYTPREIVEYMVDESLIQYLMTKTDINNKKLSALVSYDLTDDEKHPLDESEKNKITDALSQLKILDPACGSGAYPIGILQKIVFILQQIDPDSKKWIEKQLYGASPELRHHLEREFENNNFNYLRKLGVIRESIYGVDIQPIATEISRLRCFLTLIVDQSVNDSDDNRGIEPLPNLDFKLVTADSLLKLQVEEDANTQTGLFEDTSGIDELRRLRNEYFSSHNHERESLKLQFADRQNQMLQDMIASNSSGFSDLTQKLSTWKPFSHKVTSWFDPEWMFGVVDGFDIVIANPPYVQLSKSETATEDYKAALRKTFNTSAGRLNTFIFFIHFAIDNLSDHGILSYIIPNTLLAQTYYSATRKYLLDKTNLKEIVTFPKMQFANATVENIVIFSTKSSGSGEVKITQQSNGQIEKLGTKSIEKFNVSPSYSFDINSNKVIDDVFNRKHTVLGELCMINQAIALKGDRKASLEKSKINDDCYPVLDGRNIGKYSINWGGEFLNYDINKIHSCKRKDIFQTKEKLFFRRVSKNLIFAYDDKQYFGLNTLVVVTARDKCPVNLKYLLGLLNSKLINYIYENKFKSTKTVFSEIQARTVGLLPIVVSSQDEVVKTVEEIIKIKNSNPEADTSFLETKIDRVVYNIYDLSEQEINIIESYFST